MYTPKPLGQTPDAATTVLAHRFKAGRLTLVIGAGVSNSDPASLPLGTGLASMVKRRLSHGPLGATVTPLPDDLLVIADAAEASGIPEALSLVRDAIISSTKFLTAEPNYGHHAISLLLIEGISMALTTNWDNCLERSAMTQYGAVATCRLAAELVGIPSLPLLIKSHGCASIPDSLLVSTSELSNAPWWAQAQVVAALAANTVVFLGVGSIAPYLRPTLSRVLAALPPASLRSLRVVAPTLAAEWTPLLQPPLDDLAIRQTADEFLDDLLRAITLEQLSELEMLTAQIKIQNQIDLNSPKDQLIAVLKQYPAHYLWLWGRRGSFSQPQRPMTNGADFVRTLLALALVNSYSPLEAIQVHGECVTLQCRDFLVELAHVDNPIPASSLVKEKRASLRSSRAKNLITSALPIVVLSHGEVGSFPRDTLPENIVDGFSALSVVDGASDLRDRWVSRDALIGATPQQAKKLLGVP